MTEIRGIEQCSPKVSELDIVGNAKLLNSELRVGIVGTRNATEQGLRYTREIARLLASHGATIVSGLSKGIDAQAHKGALDVNGKTIAVLGTGTDIYYPESNAELQRQIEREGCVVSEYPKGTKPLPWHFPIRNRIIAALSDYLIIPEGTIKGGVRITVDLAMAMGKPVAVLPGDIESDASTLCNTLLKSREAEALLKTSDALEFVGLSVNA